MPPPALLGRSVRWPQPAPSDGEQGRASASHGSKGQERTALAPPGWTQGAQDTVAAVTGCQAGHSPRAPLTPPPAIPPRAQLRARVRRVKRVQPHLLAPALAPVPSPAGTGRAQLPTSPLTPASPKIGRAGVTQPPTPTARDLPAPPGSFQAARTFPASNPLHSPAAQVLGAPQDPSFRGWLCPRTGIWL